MRESLIEQHLVERVKALGGEVRKVKWLDRVGAPDRLVLLPRNATRWARLTAHVFVELKATGKPVKSHQQREHDRLRALGCQVEVFDSIEEIDAWLA